MNKNSLVNAQDEYFMNIALEEAEKGDFPFGAVIEKNGELLSKGHNLGIKLNDPTAHAEMMAIRNYTADHPAENLNDATIYTTGEPCPMCAAALIWCGIGRIVYAASIHELSSHINQIMIPCETVLDAARFRQKNITHGVLRDKAISLFKSSSF
ncbi:MAG: nucleoside deaminase [Methylocystis sp.]